MEDTSAGVSAHSERRSSVAAPNKDAIRLRKASYLLKRVKDIDLGRGTIIIHDGKDVKHRVVTLPRALESRLKAHLDKQRENHADDLADRMW